MSAEEQRIADLDAKIGEALKSKTKRRKKKDEVVSLSPVQHLSFIIAVHLLPNLTEHTDFHVPSHVPRYNEVRGGISSLHLLLGVRHIPSYVYYVWWPRDRLLLFDMQC